MAALLTFHHFSERKSRSCYIPTSGRLWMACPSHSIRVNNVISFAHFQYSCYIYWLFPFQQSKYYSKNTFIAVMNLITILTVHHVYKRSLFLGNYLIYRFSSSVDIYVWDVCFSPISRASWDITLISKWIWRKRCWNRNKEGRKCFI